MHRMKWSNLEYVLAVAKEGSAAGAARLLGVNHATVIRRIQAFESQLDEPVFEHRRDGYRLTEAGQIFMEAAQSIEDIISALDRKAAGGQQKLSGHVRITTTDSLFPVLVKEVPNLREAYPEITLSISITNKRLDLFKRDADLALRPSDDPPDDLLGRRIGELTFHIYSGFPIPDETALKDLPWVGFETPLADSSFGQLFNRFSHDFKVVARADSFVSIKQLAEEKVGLAFLPAHLGDSSPHLMRLDQPVLAHNIDVWLLSHPDIIRAQRVRVCADFLFKALRKTFAPV